MYSLLSELYQCTCVAVCKHVTRHKAATRVPAKPALKCITLPAGSPKIQATPLVQARTNKLFDRKMLVGRRQSEIKRRSRPRRRFHPRSPTMPLDGLDRKSTRLNSSH